ncbi:MAG: lamin tail domain-containing protein [Thermoplasmatota archaeon]
MRGESLVPGQGSAIDTAIGQWEPSVVVNEVCPDPDSDHNGDGLEDQNDEYVELFNRGTETVYLTDWSIRDNSGRFTLDNKTVPPGGRLVLWRNETGLALGRDDMISLHLPNGTMVDAMSWQDITRGASLQRSPDGSERIRTTSLATPGEDNIFPPMILLNEVMMDPEGSNTGNQWFELLNSGGPEDLNGFTLTNGESFSAKLPEVLIMPGERIVIVSTGSELLPGDLGDCSVIKIGMDKTLYVSGDDLTLIDPDGYAVDFLAWGSSTHVGRPMGLFSEEAWSGKYYDADLGGMSTSGMNNPVPAEGRSLQRAADGMDNNSPKEWTIAPGSVGHTMGYDNGLDPSMEIEPLQDTFLFNSSSDKMLDLEFKNTGNMTGVLGIDVFSSDCKWEVEMKGTGFISMERNSSASLEIAVRSPDSIQENRTAELKLEVYWTEIPFLDLGKSYELLMPGPDLKFGEIEFSFDGERMTEYPQGSIIEANVEVLGGGEIDPGDTRLRALLKPAEENFTSTREEWYWELPSMKKTSRRTIGFEIDTLDLAGDFQMELLLDPDNETAEIDEANNGFTFTFNVLPSCLGHGHSTILIDRVLWNVSRDVLYLSLFNPLEEELDISGMKISDGIEFSSFPAGTSIGPRSSAFVFWGAPDPSISGGSLYRSMSTGVSTVRMVHHGSIPDLFSTGELHLLGEFRQVIDTVFLKREGPGEIDYFKPGGVMETTWGTPMCRIKDSLGNPMDTNSSLDWRVDENPCWIKGFLPAPGQQGMGEVLVLSSGAPFRDLSGHMVISGRRALVLPSGTISDERGLIVLSSEPESYFNVQGEPPDLKFGTAAEIVGMEIQGCVVPGWNEFLLPNGGGEMQLVGPGGNLIQSVRWGAGGEGSIGVIGTDIMVWSTSEGGEHEGSWRLLSQGAQPVEAMRGPSPPTSVEASFFRDGSSLMSWVLESEDTVVVISDAVSDISICGQLIEKVSLEGDVSIIFTKPPWSGLPGIWEEYAPTDIRSRIAVNLMEIGADIFHVEDEDTGMGPSLAFSGGRLAIFGGPLAGSSEDGECGASFFIGLEDMSGNLLWEDQVMGRYGIRFRDSEPMLDLLDINAEDAPLYPPIQTSPPFFKAYFGLEWRDWLGDFDVEDGGDLRFLPGPGPFDEVFMAQTIEKGASVSLLLNPRDLRVLGNTSLSKLGIVPGRLSNGIHLLSREELENDVFLRSAALSDIFGAPSNRYSMKLGPASWAVENFLGYLLSPDRFEVMLPGVTEDAIGYRLCLCGPTDVGAFPWWSEEVCSEVPVGFLPGSWESSLPYEKTEVRLEEVYYDTYLANDPDEYVALRNCGEEEVDLKGFFLTDDEGLGYSSDGILGIEDAAIAPGGMLFIARDGEAFLSQNGFDADLAFSGTGRDSGIHVLTGDPRLSNGNETISLRDPLGRVIDVVVYGSAMWPEDTWASLDEADWSGGGAPDVGWGKILYRKGPHSFPFSVDTNDPADWTADRPRHPGQSRFPIFSERELHDLKFGVSPDSSSDLMADILKNAARTLDINVYEICAQWMVSSIIGASLRGVEVRVIAEGNPVSGIPISGKAALRRLVDEGIDVRLMYTSPQDGIRDRYRYDHAKYVISDSTSFLISTENFKESSFPAPGGDGDASTRGWIVSGTSSGICRDLSDIFEDDWQGGDMMDASLLAGNWSTGDYLNDISEGGHPSIFSSEEITSSSTGWIIASPDQISQESNPLLDSIEEAVSTIDLELLDLDPFFIDVLESVNSHKAARITNPYLRKVMEASERGVRVRILMDGSDFDGDGIPDNRPTADQLSSWAEAKDLKASFQVKLHPASRDVGEGAISMIHAKGMVVDSESVWISSFNWNPTSANENREVGILLSSPGAGQYFGRVFDFDWNGTLAAEVSAANVWAGATFVDGKTCYVEMEMDLLWTGDGPVSIMVEGTDDESDSERILLETEVPEGFSGRLELGAEVDPPGMFRKVNVKAGSGGREIQLLSVELKVPSEDSGIGSIPLMREPYIPVIAALIIAIGASAILEMSRILRARIGSTSASAIEE